jgi:hypothetical protein
MLGGGREVLGGKRREEGKEERGVETKKKYKVRWSCFDSVNQEGNYVPTFLLETLTLCFSCLSVEGERVIRKLLGINRHHVNTRLAMHLGCQRRHRGSKSDTCRCMALLAGHMCPYRA